MAHSEGEHGPGLFPSTRWTLVLAARERPELRRRALAELVEPRWKALYVLARKQGLAPAAAEDAVQSFIARLLEDADLLSRLDPERGSLRAYLKLAFRHHLINAHRHDAAQKRGASARHAELDALEGHLASAEPDAELLYERAWALSLFEQALAALQQEFEAGVRQGPFEVLRQLFAFGTAPPYEELARRHAMSVPQLKAFVHRAKARFRSLLLARVADTLTDASAADAEVRRLIQVLAR